MLSMRVKSFFALTLVLAALPAIADERPDVGANLVVQSVADALRDFTNADGAFMPAGLLKETLNKDDLATIIQYPTDEVVVLTLSGEQIRQAFERSVSLYPQANKSFLQISGFEVTFRKAGPPNQRIVSVTASGSPLQDGRTYSVAMPSLLAKGGLGYFKIWDDLKPTKTFPNTTLEDVLKGKRATEGTPRWTAQG